MRFAFYTPRTACTCRNCVAIVVGTTAEETTVVTATTVVHLPPEALSTFQASHGTTIVLDSTTIQYSTAQESTSGSA